MSGFANPNLVLPKPFEVARVERTFAALDAEGLTFEGPPRAVLEAAFGNSPYLSRLALRERALLQRLFAKGPEAVVEDAMAQALSASDATDQNGAMASLRIAKAAGGTVHRARGHRRALER